MFLAIYSDRVEGTGVVFIVLDPKMIPVLRARPADWYIGVAVEAFSYYMHSPDFTDTFFADKESEEAFRETRSDDVDIWEHVPISLSEVIKNQDTAELRIAVSGEFIRIKIPWGFILTLLGDDPLLHMNELTPYQLEQLEKSK